MYSTNLPSLFFIPLSGVDPSCVDGDLDVGGGFTSSVNFVGDQANSSLKYLCQPEHVLSSDWPLVLFGPSGTGKTVIGLSIAADFSSGSDQKMTVLAANSFRRRFASAIDTGSIIQFRENLFKSSVVFVDNLHDLAGYEAAQIELASLLDRLVELDIPVVFTVNDLALLSNSLNHRLSSRLSGGLCLSVNAPGQNARQFLFSESAHSFGLQISDDAVNYLAEKLPVTFPKIRSFFAQFAVWLKQEDRNDVELIDLTLITEFISSRKGSNRRIIDSIVRDVAKRSKLTVANLKSNSRKQSIVLARGIAIYVLRNLLSISYSKIGDIFGGRDHSTIMHSISRIESLIENNQNNIVKTIKQIEQSAMEKCFLEVESLCE